MGREVRRKREPVLPEVKKVDLPEKTPIGRKIALVLLIVLAVASFAYGISSLTNPGSGWEEIQFSGSDANCARDFTLMYETGRGGASSVTERKLLTNLFTDTMTTGYRLFSVTEDFEDTVSVHTINTHPNEELTVDPMLYNALKTLCDSGTRILYLGPVYDQYRSVFYSDSADELLEYDPLLNPEVAEYVQEILTWCQNPEAIELTFPAENRVCLRVSEAYLAFAEKYAIENLIDVFVYADAFITDAMAEKMISAGMTRGCISSSTGFVRNLDSTENQYTLVLSDGRGQSANAYYYGGVSIALLSDHALATEGTPWFCQAPDGSLRTPYLALENGECVAPAYVLGAGVSGSSCGKLLTELLPLWLSGKVDMTDAVQLGQQGTSVVLWDENGLVSIGTELTVAPEEREQ